MAGIVRFDCYEVDIPAGWISKRGTTLRLRAQAFRVLAALLERPGQVVTREELRHRLWPDEVFVDFDNLLNTAVGRLREALDDSADRPRFIETLPKRGYRFIAPVEQHVPAGDRAGEPRPRLLVLPFLNTSGDPAQDYFADAMTDEFIAALAAFAPDELAVIARTTAFHYKATRKEIATIAGELRLDYVVEGSAQRDGDSAALSVQLIRASDQTQVWAERHVTTLDDLFGIQKATAETIGGALGITRSGARPAARKPTEDLTAHTLYRQGRHQLIMQTPGNFAAAKRCFEQAIERDPQFALAYDALADLWWYYDFLGFAPPETVAGIGMAYALRALEIDNTLAETHALLGLFRRLFDYDWPALKRHLDRARELNPTSPLVRVRYAMGPLLIECRIEEAIAELQAALESDPLSTFIRFWLATMFYLARQYDRAIEQARLIVAIDPENYAGYWLVAAGTGGKGLFDEAIAACRKAVELSGGSMLMFGGLGLALGLAGRTAEARAVLERLQSAADRHVYVPPTCFAWTYLGLGDIDNAFLWLDRAVDASDHMMVPIRSYPLLDPLRGDPRYAELLRKMKLTTV